MSDDLAWMKEYVREIMIRNADARLISHKTEEVLPSGTVLTTYHLTKECEDALTLRLKPESANSLVREVPVTPKSTVLGVVGVVLVIAALVSGLFVGTGLVMGIIDDRRHEQVVDCHETGLHTDGHVFCAVAVDIELDIAVQLRQALVDHATAAERDVQRRLKEQLDHEDQVRRAYIAAPGETEEHRAKRFHNFWTEKFK